MAKIKPETLRKRRIKEVTAAFKDISVEKMNTVKPMINLMVNIEFDLMKLKEEVDKVGYVEEYQNGNNQFGTKESTASKAYSSMIKNYNNIVKTLLSVLPEEEQQEASDGFDEFLQGKR